MEFIDQYMRQAAEIIGERTPDEERYDREVLRWLEKGKAIKKAIARANERYPKEALEGDDEEISDVQSRYEYLLEHERIIRKLKT